MDIFYKAIMFGFIENTSFEMEGLQITMEFSGLLVLLFFKEHSSKR